MSKISEMTDAELIHAVAVEVMGWEFVLSSPKNPQPNEFDIYIKVRDENGDADELIYCIDWNPLTNANHRDMVVERMRGLGYRCEMKVLAADVWADFFKNYTGRHYPAGGELLGRAVCEAALEAVRNG